MFRRRVPLSLKERFRTLLFPPGGWRRTAVFLWKRLCRLPGTSTSIARGVAWGVTIAVSPFWGAHLWLAIGLAWLSRGSMVAAAIGTLAGNPWTMPLIIAGTYQMGLWMLPPALQPPALDIGAPTEAVKVLMSHPLRLLLPMLVGWVPVGLVSWLATFWLARRAVAEYHRRRRGGGSVAPPADLHLPPRIKS